MHVLIIDDDAENVDVLRDVLTFEGHRVDVASDGAQALRRLASGPLPDVILLDLLMPRMNGAEFRAAQLADARIAQLPVVVVSALTLAQERARGIQLGGARMLRKPFQAEQLFAALVEATASRAAAASAPAPG